MSLQKANQTVIRITSLLYNMPEQAQFCAAIYQSNRDAKSPVLVHTTRESFINALRHSRNKTGGSHNHCVYSWDGTALILHGVC